MPDIVIFEASDESRIEVRSEVAVQALLVRDLLEDAGGDDEVVVPLPAVSNKTLQHIVQYLNQRVAAPQKDIERPLRNELFSVIDAVDADFVRSLDEDTVLQLLSAAMFLNYPALKALASARCAEWMKVKSVEEIRAMFGMENDFTDDEIAALKKEHGLDMRS